MQKDTWVFKNPTRSPINVLQIILNVQVILRMQIIKFALTMIKI